MSQFEKIQFSDIIGSIDISNDKNKIIDSLYRVFEPGEFTYIKNLNGNLLIRVGYSLPENFILNVTFFQIFKGLDDYYYIYRCDRNGNIRFKDEKAGMIKCDQISGIVEFFTKLKKDIGSNSDRKYHDLFDNIKENLISTNIFTYQNFLNTTNRIKK